MQLLFLNQWFGNNVMEAVTVTLLHSLWIGVLAAALAGLVILLTRKASPAVRYNVLSLIVVLFVVACCFVFIGEMGNRSASPEAASSSATITPSQPQQFTDETTMTVPVAELPMLVTQYADVIFYGWLFIFFLHLLRFAAGFGGIRQLRRRSIPLDNAHWQQKVQRLARGLGINQVVQLVESRQVKIPAVIGILKPVILLPFGLLTRIPQDQLESILLHELAHIRRKDYLMNLLQHFIESIFFFNPGLRWISFLIRQEREACCDEIVLRNISAPARYFEALVAFQEYRRTPGVALGLISRQTFLLNRVRRMLTRNNKNLSIMEKISLIAGIIALSAFTFLPGTPAAQVPAASPAPVVAPTPVAAPAQPAPPARSIAGNPAPARVSKQRAGSAAQPPAPAAPASPASPAAPAAVSIPDTVPTPPAKTSRFSSVSVEINDDGETREQEIEATDRDGKKYNILRVNNEMKELRVDGKVIPSSEYGNYQQVITEIDARHRKGHIGVNRDKKPHDINAWRHEKNAEMRAARKEKDAARRKEQDLVRKKRTEDRIERAREIKLRNELQRKQHAIPKSKPGKTITLTRNEEKKLFMKKENIVEKKVTLDHKLVLNKTKTIHPKPATPGQAVTEFPEPSTK